MISSIFNTLVYNPLYNGLVALMNVIPWADVGVVVIVFTVIVKLILFPLAQKSVKTQVALRALEPELSKIRTKYKNNKEEQARKTMELYRENKLNPFSGFLLILIQLPIIFALYFIFLRGGLPDIHRDILYPFVSSPESVNVTFLGLLNLFERNILLALITGIAQYLQGYFVAPPKSATPKDDSIAASLSRSMHLQVRYVMPVIIAFVAYSLPAIVGLYWTTSTVFTIVQELVVRRTTKLHSEASGDSRGKVVS